MRSKLLLLLVLCLFVHSAAAQEEYTPEFIETDCLFDVADITCAVLVVPEDRSDPAGNQVELAVVIIHSLSAEPEPDPVIYLEGGPGGWGLLNVEDLQKLPILETRDIIVFDQRGTGLSFPSLNCPEMETDGDVEACRNRLAEEGVNLDMYNTANSAADVDDLRFALGYEQVNLYGISYGTKLALTVLRDYPEGVRSVVIDSVYPPEIDDLGLTAVSYVGALNALYERCASDPDCDEVFPDLENVFLDVVGALNESPVMVEGEDGETELTGDEVLSQMFLALYDSKRIPYLPYAIYLLASTESEEDVVLGYDVLTGAVTPGDEEEIPPSAIMDSEDIISYMEEFGEIDDSEGMNLSFDCSEEYLLNDADAAFENAAGAPDVMQEYFTLNIQSVLADCEIWGVATAPDIESQRVESDIPVLIVSGMFDPVTPPSSGDSASEGLPNSLHLVFPTAGHGITFTDSEAGECAKQIVVDFIDTLSTDLDTACIEETDFIAFFFGE